MNQRSSESSFGINVIGYAKGRLGLGVMGRNIIRLLLKKELPIAVYDLDAVVEGEDELPDLDRYMVPSIEALPYSINFFVIPVLDLPWLILEHRHLVLRADRLNVACIAWELPVLPKTWKAALEFCDLVVAPSHFVQNVCTSSLSGVMTTAAEPPVFLPEHVTPCRGRFGLPEDKVIFVSSFDPRSDAVRKNPFAVVSAFQEGAKNNPDAYLLLKLNNARCNGAVHSVLPELQRRCADDRRIRILSDSLTYPDVIDLYASCDVFISLHRAEGLGLGPMEAMSLGMPVIATGWSGNLSFMNHANSCLVSYDLVPVEGGIEYYTEKFLGQPALWAEPKVREAAEWIRQLCADSDLRTRVGAIAAQDMAQYQARASQGGFVDEILNVARQSEFLSARRRDRLSMLRDLREMIYDHEHNGAQRVMRRVRMSLDRHLFWRLHRQTPAANGTSGSMSNHKTKPTGR